MCYEIVMKVNSLNSLRCLFISYILFTYYLQVQFFCLFVINIFLGFELLYKYTFSIFKCTLSFCESHPPCWEPLLCFLPHSLYYLSANQWLTVIKAQMLWNLLFLSSSLSFSHFDSFQICPLPFIEHHSLGNNHLMLVLLMHNNYYDKHGGKWQKLWHPALNPLQHVFLIVFTQRDFIACSAQ